MFGLVLTMTVIRLPVKFYSSGKIHSNLKYAESGIRAEHRGPGARGARGAEAPLVFFEKNNLFLFIFYFNF